VKQELISGNLGVLLFQKIRDAVYQCYDFYAKYACSSSDMVMKTTNAQNV